MWRAVCLLKNVNLARWHTDKTNISARGVRFNCVAYHNYILNITLLERAEGHEPTDEQECVGVHVRICVILSCGRIAGLLKVEVGVYGLWS